MEYEESVDEERLEHVLEFKYFGCFLDESDKDEVDFRRKMSREEVSRCY